MKSLYYQKETYFLDMFGKIKHNRTTLYADRNNCRSERQIQRWLLMNDLLNVSAWLNGEWAPDWSDPSAAKFALVMRGGKVTPAAVPEPCHVVYFKDEETASEAVRILGEERLRAVLEGV